MIVEKQSICLVAVTNEKNCPALEVHFHRRIAGSSSDGDLLDRGVLQVLDLNITSQQVSPLRRFDQISADI